MIVTMRPALVLLVQILHLASTMKLMAIRSDLGNWGSRPVGSLQCGGSKYAIIDMENRTVRPQDGGQHLEGCYHSDSGVAHVLEMDIAYVAVRWNMSTDLGDENSPTHIAAFHPTSGRFVSTSSKALQYIPWALAYDRTRKRLLGIWVNDDKKVHEVVEIEAAAGNHTVLHTLPRDPYCITQSHGDCQESVPAWGKAMLDHQRRRWTLPLSSQLGWNLTLVHLDIDNFSITEVPVLGVGYYSNYSTVTNTALDTSSSHRFIVALCGKCVGWMGSVCSVEKALVIHINPESGEITEVPGITGTGWTVGSANSVYDQHASIMYYIRYTEASFSQRDIVALSTNGTGPIAIQNVGSELPPDLLLLLP